MTVKEKDSILVEHSADDVSVPKDPECNLIIKNELDDIITYMREKGSTSVYELLRKFSKRVIQLALIKQVLVKLNVEEQILITLGSEKDISKYYDMCRIDAELLMGYNYWS